MSCSKSQSTDAADSEPHVLNAFLAFVSCGPRACNGVSLGAMAQERSGLDWFASPRNLALDGWAARTSLGYVTLTAGIRVDQVAES